MANELSSALDMIDGLISRLEDHEPSYVTETEKIVEKFKQTFDFYQEQPELLDPYLTDIISKLTSNLNRCQKSSKKYHIIFKLIYHLIKVSGFKSIGKKFPHEINKLPQLIELLENENPKDR